MRAATKPCAAVLSLIVAQACAGPVPAEPADAAQSRFPPAETEPMSYPMLQLTNGVLDMRIYTPDREAGFYRGVRFDWSGIIERVEYKGHRFYGPWRSPHQPTGNDFVSGPAGEFAMDAPMGFDEAAPGQSFVKIGVGILRRADEEDYTFAGEYELIKAGEWAVDNGGNWVEFRQELKGDRGWAYRYTKRISLGEAEPTFALVHKLENIGTRTIDIDHYNHNFTLIDGVPFGPDYTVTFPFAAKEPREIKRGLAWFRGTGIEVLKPLGGESLWIRLRGAGGVADNGCTVRNNKTGAAVSFAGNVPIKEFRFWAVETAACPEPFIRLKIAPGKSAEWTWNYVLSVDGSLRKTRRD